MQRRQRRRTSRRRTQAMRRVRGVRAREEEGARFVKTCCTPYTTFYKGHHATHIYISLLPYIKRDASVQGAHTQGLILTAAPSAPLHLCTSALLHLCTSALGAPCTPAPLPRRRSVSSVMLGIRHS